MSLLIAPELRARIVSWRDRISGRECLGGWSPASKRRIWYLTDPSHFETGPGAGIDECLPTVLPCKIQCKSLPDHGEIWNQPPEFEADPKTGFLCHWNLKCLPVAFTRRIALRKNAIHFDYRIENQAESATPFLWALYPLFSGMPDYQICATEEICVSPGRTECFPWPAVQPGTALSYARFPKGATPAAKVFLGSLAKRLHRWAEAGAPFVKERRWRLKRSNCMKAFFTASFPVEKKWVI